MTVNVNPWKAMQNENLAHGAPHVICPNCHTALTAGLRFCRMCGYRLGEGTEEYSETRRFDGRTPPVVGFANDASKGADPFTAQAAQAPWGAAPLQPVAPFAPTLPAASGALPANRWRGGVSRMGWVGWVVLSLAIFLAIGFAVKMKRERAAARGAVDRPPVVSILREVDGFETADGGGVLIEGLDGPNTSLERAGLIGGDIIVSFDGQQVRDESAMRRILGATPPGKPVQVIYIRDGETRTTMLQTAHEREYRGMELIDRRPGGRGQIGVNLGERVRVPNTNFYGVELEGVTRNQPADLAELKKGDIVVEFNGKLVRTPGDLRLRIYEAEPGSMVPVVVMRGGERREFLVKIGRSRG
jgi:S1-C subfamily serine protease